MRQRHLYSVLVAVPKYAGCTRLAEILEDLSDSVNRFYCGKIEQDLFDELKPHIQLVSGILEVEMIPLLIKWSEINWINWLLLVRKASSNC